MRNQSLYEFLGKMLGGAAVLASLLFVGYELKRNNDLAVVQSQQELLAISVELKTILTDPDTMTVLMSPKQTAKDDKQQLLFVALVGAWFDLYELVILSERKGILTDDQYTIWMNGLCTLPEHWLTAFDDTINKADNYLEEMSVHVRRCLQGELLPLES